MTATIAARPAVARRNVVAASLGALFVITVHQAAGAGEVPHIRMTDVRLKALLTSGVRVSPTLAALVQRTDEASVLVFVECAPRMASQVGARLSLMTGIRGLRYVNVRMDCRLLPKQLVALLADEIQHAVEIGERTDITDVDAMESFYEDVGFQSYSDGHHRRYETDRAIAIQKTVAREVERADYALSDGF